MITIRVKPARLRFGGRKQWKFEIIAGNGKRIDPRDTYANVGDIRAIIQQLVAPSMPYQFEPVEIEVHYPDEIVTERIR